MAEPNLDIEDPAQLLRYLRQSGHVRPDEEPQIRVLVGGVSNRTVLVERPPGDSWVLKQALEKLRVPGEWHSSPTRIHREALGMRWLARLTPPGSITRLIFEDFDQHVIAMQAVPPPHENWKMVLLSGRVEMERVTKFGQLLGTIHRQGHEYRVELQKIFGDRSFFESLRIEPYYRRSAEQVPEAANFLHRLIEETSASLLSLVHGDYSPKNVLLHGDDMVLVDHEVIHFGDPAFDVGFSLCHLLSKAHHLAAWREAFAQAGLTYWGSYWQTLGSGLTVGALEARCVRHTLACLLARVAGRSPLEYLTASERSRQRCVVLKTLERPPYTIEELIRHFIRQL